jgi:predicted molibdopterin-dependent oxidoreductase YjgC
MPDRVRFRVDGAETTARAGTTVAAALWNAGRLATRRSVTGAARGPLCLMGICFECRVTIDGRPHRRGCLETVAEGMDVSTEA